MEDLPLPLKPTASSILRGKRGNMEEELVGAFRFGPALPLLFLFGTRPLQLVEIGKVRLYMVKRSIKKQGGTREGGNMIKGRK